MWSKSALGKTKHFLNYFTEQLYLLYQSGIALSQAFNLLAEGKFNLNEVAMLRNIEHNINCGQSLYKSLKRYPEVFPKFYLRLIELGEVSGRLSEVLHDLAKNLREQTELKQKLSAALFYPCTVLCINFLVVVALLWWVVPEYANFFAKNITALPLLTQLLLNLSAILHKFWYLIACLGALTILGLRHIFKKRVYQEKLMQIYGIKALIKIHDLALLCRNLSLCLSAGLTMTQALQLCIPLSLNPRWHSILQEILHDINRGRSVLQAFKKHEFPPLLLQLIKIGEATGRLETQFLKIATIYELELASTLSQLTRLLEPLMMILLGLIIGSIMYALYQPLIQLGNLL